VLIVVSANLVSQLEKITRLQEVKEERPKKSLKLSLNSCNVLVFYLSVIVCASALATLGTKIGQTI